VTPQRLQRFKKLLDQARREALLTGPVKIEPNRKDTTDVGASDEDAQALSEMLQAIGSQRNKGQSERVARIDKALRKLRDTPEDFGLCEECEEEITPRRLQTMPEATLCTDCQAARDPRRGMTRKKLTDYR
jgi:DnaK suppressor protein